jgi:prolyl 4-hydroxylase
MRFLIFFLAMTVGVHAEFAIETLSEKPRVYVIRNFLSDKECDHLMTLSTPYLERSTVLDETGGNEIGLLDGRRSSYGAFLPPELFDPVVWQIESRIAKLTKYPVENGESIQVLRYLKGGEYQPHFDYFHRHTEGGAAALTRGGQRVATVIMYLHAPEAGGETIFPRAKISIIPEKGMALLFYNCRENGMEDPLTFHGGSPVKAGEKWIATKWIRQGEFH